MLRVSFLLLLVLLFALTIARSSALGAPVFQAENPRPGIECGCSATGNYVAPTSKDMQSANESASTSGKYQVDSATPGSIIVSHNGHPILNFFAGPSMPTLYWGFGANEDSFVIHGLSALDQKHYVWLYNLDPDPALESEDAQPVGNWLALWVNSSVIRFSPHGRYLLYAAELANGAFFLRVHDTRTGAEYAFDTMTMYLSLAQKQVACHGVSALTATTRPSFSSISSAKMHMHCM